MPVFFIAETDQKNSGHNVSHSHKKTNRMWKPNIKHVRCKVKTACQACGVAFIEMTQYLTDYEANYKSSIGDEVIGEDGETHNLKYLPIKKNGPALIPMALNCTPLFRPDKTAFVQFPQNRRDFI